MQTLEPIGKRVARLRQQNGWTQQALAQRLAVSRVAVSHIEMDLSLPSERTSALLAGLFNISPHDLIAGSTYPQAKAERLPQVVCSFTALEVDLALLRNDLLWLSRLEGLAAQRWREALRQSWGVRLHAQAREVIDERERKLLDEALKLVMDGLEGS